jgi:hypothetical protein
VRALTTTESKVLAGGARSNYLRVRVQNYAGAWTDLTSLRGFNWVKSADWTQSVDSFVATANVKLQRDIINLSLANLVNGSVINSGGAMVELARGIKIDTATVPLGIKPAAIDWHNVFSGFIDEADWGSNPITLTARDQAGQLLQDSQIETERAYGSWEKNRAILLGTVNTPSGNLPNGQPSTTTQFWKCTTAGTTGLSEPAWPSSPANGATIADGTVVWTYQVATAWVVGQSRAVGSFGTNPTNALQNWQVTAITTGTTGSSNPFPSAPTQGQVVTDGGVTWQYYASLGGTLAETVIQSIINDTLGAGVVALNTAAPSTWYLGPYVQSRDKLFQAITTLSEQIGWDLRFNWSGTEAGGDYLLTFKAVNRSAPGVFWSFGASSYFDVQRVTRAIGDIRNAVLVAFYDSENLDLTTKQPLRSTVVATDATSISKYRRRYMELAEPATTAVTTRAIATLLANAALSDLKEPLVACEVTLPYFWALELNDYVTLKANQIHFDADQSVAVVSIKHSFSIAGDDGSGTESTVIGVRGLPTLGPQRHLDKEGGASAPHYSRRPPIAASGITVTPTIAGARITINLPPVAGPRYQVPELHISTTNGFTPDATTMVDQGLKRSFSLANLTPGTTYYAVILMRDQRGNVAGASSQTSFVAGLVQGIHLAPGAVTNLNIASGTINATSIANNSITPQLIATSAITPAKLDLSLLTAARYKVAADQSTGTTTTPASIVFASKVYDGQAVMNAGTDGVVPAASALPWRFRVRLRIQGVTPGTSWRAVITDTSAGTVLITGEECRVFTDETGVDVAIAVIDETAPVVAGHVYKVSGQSVVSYSGSPLTPVYATATVKADATDPRGAAGNPVAIPGSFFEVLPVAQ